MPLVFVNQRVRARPSVSIDDAAGAAVATQHLINLGHRRIAFVGCGPRRPGQLGPRIGWPATAR